jgi:hypothetical protein
VARSVYKYRITLTGKEKQALRQAKRKGHTNARLVIRILIILLANAGKTMAATAELLGCCEQTVLNQRQRFLARRSEGAVAALRDLPRSGRPVTYGPQERAQITAVVCETLWERKLPLSRFSIADLRRVVIQEEGLAGLSHSSLGRILRQDALKPWRYRYWLFPRAPDFVSKACVVLDLYAGFWEGQRLGPDEYALSADEKSIQILARCHPGLPAIPGYEQRVEFEYERHGTVAYHAAWDIFRGKIFGRVAPTTSIATFNQLIDLVMSQVPYKLIALRIRPRPASSGSLTPVADQATLTQRLLAFQDYYQEVAKPFSWKFTSTDLKKRIEAVQAFSLQLGFTLKTSETLV